MQVRGAHIWRLQKVVDRLNLAIVFIEVSRCSVNTYFVVALGFFLSCSLCKSMKTFSEEWAKRRVYCRGFDCVFG